MKNVKKYYPLVLSIIASLLTAGLSFAQKKLNWYVTAGAGATAMRGFNSSFSDLQYDVRTEDASIWYGLNSKPDYLLHTGIGVSGTFQESGLLGWDVGLNIRSAGFRLTPELVEQTGELPNIYSEMLPEFGKTRRFRYWALHMPISINYLPFQYVGFTAGADLYYQFSPNITDDQPPYYGRLGQAMGLAFYTPEYQHPFQAGAHVGVFVPINEKCRLDLDFFTDITPRLEISRVGSSSVSDSKFREMGIRLNTRYYLK
ncbi:hypothetical protein [Sphingobacterium griseoflavum]|uniref:Outer membrane protein beta-barrel domain-containing protein n=1 Tax=Sphingobacterium griseoflavum TaxID=1474952 RepID=A0ABQ3HUC3_9SPHI|nr:hypothetical protein [Sphingobacterium griseoflavum]GHE23067.1 hypothetical protein GCM10017764_00350 [Sphingobacterium griseoflavum]